VAEQKALSKGDFLRALVGQAESFLVPDVGTVVLRPLTTVEVEEISAAANGKTVELMARAVRFGLVDPELTDDDLPELRRAVAGRFLPLAERIMTISGMGDAKRFEGEAGGGS
jgi:hypothetical protein